jgi:uncharacterized protein YfaP (DUF2135 family)
MRPAPCLLALLACASAVPAAEGQLSNPVGGWHAQGLLDGDDQAASAYPYNLIDRGAQAGRTLIRGRLSGLQQQAAPAAPGAGPRKPPRAPYTLVVNGNAMPLYTGPEGDFVRPWAFGAGSNSIELRRDDGRSERRVQFYETRGSGAKSALRVIAAWNNNQAEVDMHVITPDGQHAFWAQPVLRSGGGLDVDSVDGAGPEMFSLAQPQRGSYHFYVNYWGNFSEAGGYHFDESRRRKPIITVRMTFVLHENTPQEKRETLVVPLRRIGDLTWVRSLVW